MEGLMKAIVQALILVGALVACSSFSYKYYGIDTAQSKFLSPKPENDLPFAFCDKKNDEFQCVMMPVDEFAKMRRDFSNMRERLRACESKP
ncbi:hypothetical protein [Microcystis sp. M061S2]|uniref:hypothetical protein n=1 Tax=Microcystis sp. M061S2 TaxID=2771171 RepID=UPI002587FCA9|nr:hypothetical protein [Microcystis sp. M061S2]MCA2656370.1 hypothetical protein [Microcystis sp. M061S2]